MLCVSLDAEGPGCYVFVPLRPLALANGGSDVVWWAAVIVKHLVFAEGSVAADVVVAFLDLVLLDGGLVKTCGINLVACRRHA